MAKWLLALCLFLLASPALAAIGIDGSTAYDGCAGGNPCTSFVTGNVNTIHASAVMAVAITTEVANDTTATVSDGDKSNWSRAATIANGDTVRVEIWKCADLLGANVAITVELSSSAAASAVTQFYSGVAAFGITGTNTGTSTTPTIDLVTQDADNYAVAACANNDGSYSASAGTIRGQVDVGGDAYSVLVDNTDASPATVTNTVTITSAAWACVALELRSTTGGGGGGASVRSGGFQ